MKFFILLVAAQLISAEVFEYTTYSPDGKIVKVETSEKPKYSASINNNEVLYIKSEGLIVKRNSPQEVAPLQKFKDLCAKKDQVGCYVMALYHQDLNDLKQAVIFFDLACEYGDVKSCLVGGSHYHHRLKDFKKAVIAFKKACDKREAAGCFNLGHDYREIGDEVGAMHSFSLACTMGYTNACIEKAYSLKEKGKEVSEFQESYNIFMGYCSKGDQKSCDQAQIVSEKLKAAKKKK